MGIYTIHLRPGVAAEFAANPESVDGYSLRGVKIDREGFSWAAFIFGPLWLLWQRFWLALVLYAFFFAIFRFLPEPGDFGLDLVLVFVVHLYLGVEAHSLREWKLGRTGFRLTEIIVARSVEEAARRFFKNALKGAERGHNAPAAALVILPPSRQKDLHPANHDVLGLFSMPEHKM